MVLRTGRRRTDGEADEDLDDQRRYNELDQQKYCDGCRGEIKDVRVIKTRGGEFLGAYCSHKCACNF